MSADSAPGSDLESTSKHIRLPATDEELLAECSVQAYRASGSGGQHINKTDSAVRLTHLPTGLVVTSQTERSQLLNKSTCLRKLRDKVAKLNYRKPKRVPTRLPKAAKEEKLAQKAKRSKTKQMRRKPLINND